MYIFFVCLFILKQDRNVWNFHLKLSILHSTNLCCGVKLCVTKTSVVVNFHFNYINTPTDFYELKFLWHRERFSISGNENKIKNYNSLNHHLIIAHSRLYIINGKLWFQEHLIYPHTTPLQLFLVTISTRFCLFPKSI